MNISQPFRTLAIAAVILGSSAAAARAQPADTSADRSGGVTEQASQSPSPASVQEALDRATAAIERAEEIIEAGTPEAAQQATEYTDEALRLVNYILSANPAHARAKFIMARALILQGRPREAIGYIREYISRREGESDWLAYKLLGDLLLQGSYYQLAYARYEQAVELNSREPDVHAGLANCALARKMFEEAIEHAERAIGLETEANAAPYAILTQAYMQLNRLQEAEGAARRAIDITRDKLRETPGSRQLLNELNSRFSLALQVQRTKAALYPERPENYLAIAQLIQDQADLTRLMAYHEALAVLEQGIDATGSTAAPALLMEAARLQYAVGRNDAALETLDRLLQASPENEAAKSLRARIQASMQSQ